MSSTDLSFNVNKSASKEKKDNSNSKKGQESSKSVRPKNSPIEKHGQTPTIPERDLQSDFSLSFKEIYNYHISEIEKKTNLKRKHIYIFLGISLFFFLIGHFEIIFSYVITCYYPIKWTYQDYKGKKEDLGKKWGTYWFLFVCFIFFDLHKKVVLKIIPLYFIVKTIFFLMLYLPGFNAAVNLYHGVFKDKLKDLNSYFQSKEENDTLLNSYLKKTKVKTE